MDYGTIRSNYGEISIVNDSIMIRDPYGDASFPINTISEIQIGYPQGDAPGTMMFMLKDKTTRNIQFDANRADAFRTLDEVLYNRCGRKERIEAAAEAVTQKEREHNFLVVIIFIAIASLVCALALSSCA